MQRSRLSLKWLEVFQLAARSGSVQAVATETGLSVSTVSHHLRSLEDSLGTALLDHGRRPMLLTPAGSVFLRSVDEALRLIHRAEIEAASGDLSAARDLRLGLVEDFDSEVAPELAQFLATAMPKCTFRHHTGPSHDILALLRNREIDIGVATRPVHDVPGLVEYPLLRDPFLVALPAACTTPPRELLAGAGALPFLRYSHGQIIGGQIEAQLRRLRIALPNRFELESNQSVMGMVAGGSGWTITTAASHARARRFHGQIVLAPFPGKGFARTLSLFATEVYVQSIAEMVAETLRRLIRGYVVDPAIERAPWLEPEFYLMPARRPGEGPAGPA